MTVLETIPLYDKSMFCYSEMSQFVSLGRHTFCMNFIMQQPAYFRPHSSAQSNVSMHAGWQHEGTLQCMLGLKLQQPHQLTFDHCYAVQAGKFSRQRCPWMHPVRTCK